MKQLICFVMLVSNVAAVEDMTGKMFTFPQKSNSFYVKVNTVQTSFSAVTLCHRSFTDQKRSHSFFSLTTPDFKTYGLQTFYNSDTKGLSVWVKGVRADFEFLDYPPNQWHSICSTWNSSSGLVELWMNGQQISKKYNVEFPLTGQPQIILGQEQSNYDSFIGFLDTMSFVGMLTDVHMWDSVLPSCEIQSYMAEQHFTPGNVVNWTVLDFQTSGRIMVHNKQNCHLSTL